MSKSSLVLLSCLVSGLAAAANPAPVTDVTNGSIEQRLATVERMLATRTNVQQRMQEQLDELQNEVNDLRGSVELHSHKLEQILQRQRELYAEIDKRIAALAVKPASSGSPAPLMPGNQTAATTAQPATQADDSGNEGAAYDQAVNMILKEKRYDDAIPLFEAFLKKYPDSNYAANAYYWLGQLLFNKQDWKGAEQRFTYLIDHFSDSTKRPDSLLKLGMIAQNNHDQTKAQQYFKQVISQYPDSTAAKLADSRLKNLK